VALGRSISVDITAEGVETEDQVTMLKAAGCSIVQGFLFGSPRRDVPGPDTAQAGGASAKRGQPAAAHG
jgi:EAL domain-containing protein (putative c-di-GMP-specific phosphodiesterase class I)